MVKDAPLDIVVAGAVMVNDAPLVAVDIAKALCAISMEPMMTIAEIFFME
jgi:hypothetical protein